MSVFARCEIISRLFCKTSMTLPPIVPAPKSPIFTALSIKKFQSFLLVTMNFKIFLSMGFYFVEGVFSTVCKRKTADLANRLLIVPLSETFLVARRRCVFSGNVPVMPVRNVPDMPVVAIIVMPVVTVVSVPLFVPALLLFIVQHNPQKIGADRIRSCFLKNLCGKVFVGDARLSRPA